MKKPLQAASWRFVGSVLLSGVLILTGCGPEKKVDRGPKEVLSSYIDATINGRLEDAYQSLSSRDRSEKTLKAYIAERSDEESLIRNMMAKKISYTIRDVHVAGDKARASVDMTAPDYDRIMKDILSSLAVKDLPARNLDAHVYVSGLLGRHVKKYRDKGIPMKTTTDVFDMVEEKGEWKIAIHRGATR
jgi:hypothetical protein